MPRTAKKPDESPAGLGNMSPEDLAAIAGTITESEPEALTSGAPTSAVVAFNPASPEEVSLGARVATLTQRLSDLEKAVENLAQTTTGAAVSAHKNLATENAPVSTHKPTEGETDAYFAANFEATKAGGKPFNGIQDWRNQGSPGLKR